MDSTPLHKLFQYSSAVAAPGNRHDIPIIAMSTLRRWTLIVTPPSTSGPDNCWNQFRHVGRPAPQVLFMLRWRCYVSHSLFLVMCLLGGKESFLELRRWRPGWRHIFPIFV